MAGDGGSNVFWRAPEGVRRRGGSRPWWGLLLAVGLVAYLLVFGDAGWLAVRAENDRVRELREEVAEARARQAEFESRTRALRQPGSHELERIAREEYRMRAPGEEIHHIVGGGAETSGSAGAKNDEGASRSRP